MQRNEAEYWSLEIMFKRLIIVILVLLFVAVASAQDTQTEPTTQIDNCCLAGWNCTFDFDFIMGKWTYDDNAGQCFSPRQETVDGVIIEGSDLFIKGVKYAFDLIQASSPEWHTLVTSGAVKIREAYGKIGTGTLEQSLNLKDISTYPADSPLAQLAADIVMRNCHIHKWLAEKGAPAPEIASISEVADCSTVSAEDLLDIFSPGCARRVRICLTGKWPPTRTSDATTGGFRCMERSLTGQKPLPGKFWQR